MVRLSDFPSSAALIRKRVERAEALARDRKATGTPFRPAETPNGVLYFEAYRYYRRLKARNELEDLSAHLMADRHNRWRRHDTKGVALVLRLLEPDTGPWFLIPSNRKRIAFELDFADR